MGLLDQIGAMIPQGTGAPGVPAGDAKQALTQAVLGMLVHGNEPGGLGGAGGLGGLGGLLQRFESSGLGPQVASWIGTGANLPVSADQIKAALAGGPLQTLAEHVGLDEHQTAGYLAEFLPKIVDHLTPTGEVPAAGSPSSLTSAGGLTDAMSALGHLFGKS